jgi:predicted unusual protein kinase regulating ubiquinone biosynthesis (AarF/ABC1/UbiB family)
MIAATVVFTLLALTVVVVMVLGGSSRRLARGRAARLMRVGNLSARMWTSWFGSRLRRVFAGKEARKRIDSAQRKANAERVAETMGQMKGAFMKLGQMMSFVTDDIPEEYRAALASLQASAPPMDFALLRDVAESELGMPLERAFAKFDPKPLASASIGQVHRATLPTGEEVVVKIQYPGVAEAIKGDLANVAVLYRMMAMFYPGVEPGPIVEELRGRISEELDYANEARNQRAFHQLYDGHPFIRVPRVFDSHSTARVLTSEYVAGRRYAELSTLGRDEQQRYAEILYRFIFGSITRFGVFNGDPHPGNYLFADGKVVFLDFGCVKYFPSNMRRDWKALVRAHLSGDKQRFKSQLIALNFFKDSDALEADDLYDYFGYFYEPFHEDRVFTYTREYNSKSFGLVFKPQGKFQTMAKKLNMPPDFVFVNRIQWGVVSLLAQLEATANWHRVHREFLFDDAPSTELGRSDAEYRVRWREQRSAGRAGAGAHAGRNSRARLISM